MTHHIIVCRAPGHTGKHYRADLSTASVEIDDWISGRQVSFETIDELAEILRTVANDPHGIIIPNPAIGIPTGEPILIGTLAQVAQHRGMPNDGVWQAVRNAGPLRMADGRWLIARNLEAFAPASVLVLDRDIKPDTPSEFATGMDFNAWRASVGQIIPGADRADCVVMPSSSARIIRPDGSRLGDKAGHCWVLCDRTFDASAEPRGKGSKLSTRIKAAAMRSGQCWIKETVDGKRILQMPLDVSVTVAGRWMFSGAPTADAPLAVAPADPQLIRGELRHVSLDAIPDTSNGEMRQFNGRYGTSLDLAGDHALSLDTLVDTRDFGPLTIANLHDLYLSGALGAAEDIKLRCQAAFRPESRSWNGILRLLPVCDGRFHQWAHYDQGQALMSFLDDAGMRATNPEWTPESWKEFRTEEQRAAILESFHAAYAKQRTPEEQARRDEQKAENIRIGEGLADYVPWPETFGVDDMAARFCYVTRGKEVVDMHNRHRVLTFDEFAAATASSVTTFAPEPGSKARPKDIPNAALWLKRRDRLTAHGKTYRAGGESFDRAPDGPDNACVNLWMPRARVDVSLEPLYENHVDLFIEHVRFIFGDMAELFLDWCAHLEQFPGVLPHYGWLHVADATGCGRNWIASVLARVWAGSVAAAYDLERHIAGNFNGGLARKQLAIVDEVDLGNSRLQYQARQVLKRIVTEESRQINPKYGTQYDEWNACRWLIFSNHLSALPLDETDRRWQVVHLEAKQREPEVYEKLYAVVTFPDFIASVAWFLRSRDVSQFKPGAKPLETAARQRVIQRGKSETEQIITDIVAEFDRPIMTGREFLRRYAAAGGGEVKNWAEVKNIFDRLGVRRWESGNKETQLEISRGNRVTVWVMPEFRQWVNADRYALLAEINHQTINSA